MITSGDSAAGFIGMALEVAATDSDIRVWRHSSFQNWRLGLGRSVALAATFHRIDELLATLRHAPFRENADRWNHAPLELPTIGRAIPRVEMHE
jgi:hypothetical protein